jgi:predicted O-methyltransferase YrrM
MKQIDLKKLKLDVDVHLKKELISGKLLLDRFCMINEDSRKSPSYSDPKFTAFYYHLGKYLEPKSLLEVGFDLGLFSGCFMISCKTVEKFLAFRENKKDYYFSSKIGQRNIKKYFKGPIVFHFGTIYDDLLDKNLSQPYDMIIITMEQAYDKQLEYMEFFWPHLSENGIMVCENIIYHEPTKEAFDAFAFSKNREPIIFSTRNGTGILQK